MSSYLAHHDRTLKMESLIPMIRGQNSLLISIRAYKGSFPTLKDVQKLSRQ